MNDNLPCCRKSSKRVLLRSIETQNERRRDRDDRRKATKPAEQSFEFNTLTRELRAETYNGLVRQLKPGCRTLVLICDSDSKGSLVKEFTRIVWPWRKNKTLLFAYLLVEKNLEWFKRMLEETVESNRLTRINPRNVVGTVLALNGFRQYFQIYHAMHVAVSDRRKSGAGRNRKQKSDKKDGAWLGFDDASSDSSDNSGDSDTKVPEAPLMDEEAAASSPSESNYSPSQDAIGAQRNGAGGRILTGELLAGLPNWLDRLFEGSITRYYISEWPSIR